MLVPPVGQVLPPDVLNTHTAWVKASKEIVGLMLMTMNPDIQKNLEHLRAYDMLKELKMFYIDNLEHLSHAMTQNLAVSLILVSLRKEYDSFVQNYNMHSMGNIVTELHAMLKLHEQTLPQKEVEPALYAIRSGRVQKNQKKKSHKAGKGNQGKGKAKMSYAPVAAPPFAPKPENPPTPKKDNLAKDAICHQCGEVGYWRRNCPIYLGELMKKKKLSQGASTSAVEAIGEFHLCLPSGLVLILHNCHYAPSITRGIILVSRLYKDGFVNRFENDNTIAVSRNNLHCRLGNINKKRMEKLQHDRLLNSADIKQGASYFVTFTDDFSRYGYVYLLKHKHEVFETFKVFQKEVENQLGKTIKSLHSDRGERRNRTLLDMVRSMMSQTTLPKSFWDYDLESVARILNMVPTKKVDKTPYEVWHGQAPKLSYLEV
ncbi:zinc finger, CCHC-type containing protein [Tanacetum coccineum]